MKLCIAKFLIALALAVGIGIGVAIEYILPYWRIMAVVSLILLSMRIKFPARKPPAIKRVRRRVRR